MTFFWCTQELDKTFSWAHPKLEGFLTIQSPRFDVNCMISLVMDSKNYGWADGGYLPSRDWQSTAGIVVSRLVRSKRVLQRRRHARLHVSHLTHLSLSEHGPLPNERFPAAYRAPEVAHPFSLTDAVVTQFDGWDSHWERGFSESCSSGDSQAFWKVSLISTIRKI